MVVMSQNKAMNRLWVVGGAVGIQLALGALYAWSVFTSPLVEAGWTKLDTMIVFSVCLAVFALVMLWSGKQMEKIGPKKLTLFGGLLFGGGYLFAGLFAGTDFWLITLFIGVMAGAGLGLAYVVPIAVGMRWFPDKKGLITGLAVAGFGFGALLWVKLAGEWLQLIKIYGLSGAFAIYGVVFTMMVVLGSLVMIFPPEGWKPSGWSQSAGAGGVAAAGSVDFESRQMLATPQFYMIFLTLLFGSSAGLMSIGLMKLYPTEALQAAGISMAEAGAIAGTAMAIFFSLANGIGRIGWGIISDKIGRRYAISAMYALQGIAVLSFTFMAGNEYLLYLGAAVIGFNFGGNFALFPAFTADTFGARNVGNNYPWVFLSYGVGGILGPILGGVLGDMGNFPLAFTLCGAACMIGAVLSFMATPPQKAVVRAVAVPVRRQQAHYESMGGYQDLDDFLPQPLCEFAPDGKLLFVNRRCCEAFGYSRAEIHQEFNVLDMISVEDRQRAVENISKVLDGKSPRGAEFLMKKKSGDAFPAIIFSSPVVRDGVVTGLRSIVVDMTERKRRQRETEQSEARYKSLVENSYAGVYVIQDGRFVFLNENAATYAGYKPSELIGRPVDSIVHPEDRGRISEQARKMLRGEESSPYEFRIVTKEGRNRWIMETVASIEYDGQTAVLGNSMDVTERKQMQ
jgi:OFA family oxalate/formate antiporter-like MFS transporter